VATSRIGPKSLTHEPTIPMTAKTLEPISPGEIEPLIRPRAA
jgi:hypothetical protein